jgi:hypothetical protein
MLHDRVLLELIIVQNQKRSVFAQLHFIGTSLHNFITIRTECRCLTGFTGFNSLNYGYDIVCIADGVI